MDAVPKAVEIFTKLASAGNSDAAYCLGVCYAAFTHDSPNPQKAFPPLMQAAASGDVRAAAFLATFFLRVAEFDFDALDPREQEHTYLWLVVRLCIVWCQLN